MKTLTVSLLALFLMVGCGSDSGRKAESTLGNKHKNYNDFDYSGNYDFCTDRDYDCTSTTSDNSSGQYDPGITPASYGESSFGGLEASYNARSHNDVVAKGNLKLDQDYGFLDCTISKGSYKLTTTSPGQTGDISHHYKNIQIRLGSNINATLENVVAMENVQGQWVQDARIKISTVNGRDCSLLSLSFAMPFAN